MKPIRTFKLVDVKVLFFLTLLCTLFAGRIATGQDGAESGDAPAVTAPKHVSSKPLPDRAETDAPLLRRLDGTATGIRMVNPLRFDHPNWFRFESSFAGGGVAIGDYDRDGRPDVFVSGQLAGSKLYRQTASFQFHDATKRAGLKVHERWTTGAAFVDLNDDGWLDLYVCHYRSPNQLYINQKDGTFSEQGSAYNLDLRRPSVSPEFSDYDRDGDLDLYLVTWRVVNRSFPTRHCETVGSGENLRVRQEDRNRCQVFHPDGMKPVIQQAGHRDYLLRNDGGHFTDVTEQAGLKAYEVGNDAAWLDYNRDGWPDLYVANDYWDPDHLYRNDGDGTFTDVTETVLPHLPYSSMGVATGDLNGDGQTDLIGTAMAGRTYEQRARDIAHVVSKFSGWFFTDHRPLQYKRNAVYLNNELNRFREVAYLTQMARTNWTWSVKIQDLNSDGRNDVLYTTGMTRDLIDMDYSRQLAKLKAMYKRKYHQRSQKDKAAEKEWKKKWLRHRRNVFEQGPTRREKNLVFRNRGDLRFQRMGAAWGFDRKTISFGAAFGDLDRDGDLDLVVNNVGSPVSVYENTDSTGHRLLLRLQGRESNRYGIGARVILVTPEKRQVKYLNPFEGYMSADEPLIHFGLGDQERIEKLVIHWPGGSRQVVRNPEPDRLYTIREPVKEDQTRTVQPDGPGSEKAALFHTTELPFVHDENDFNDMDHQSLLPWQHSRLGPGLAWGDANGDGDPDLFVGGAAGQSGRLFINRDGRLQARKKKGPWKRDADHEDMAVLWIDVNEDGHRDLFVASGSSEFKAGAPEQADRIYINRGDGTFKKPAERWLPFARVYSGPAAAVDYDRDGDLDLFVGGRLVPRSYPDPSRSRLLENRDGRFVDVTGTVAPGLRTVGMVTGALWTDVNGDGWMDLLLTREWGPITYFQNTGEGPLVEKTAAAGLENTSGLWNGITGTDVNRDGRMDYVVTNLGWNTRYNASPDRPYLLYSGDFNGDETSELVEALYDGEELYPMRELPILSYVFPFLQKEFKTFKSYSKSTLTDLFPPEKLQNARRLKVTELKSVVLMNQPDGTFQVRPAPVEAQVSPGFGAVSTALDGRPGEDVFMAQNFFSPHPETGRMDGGIGVLLSRRRNGTFDAVAPGESGIALTGDMMAAASADVDGDGWPDVAVSRNDDSVVLLNHRRGGGRAGGTPPIRIRLRQDGSPAPPGTRVTLVAEGRVRGVRERYAGEGYLSQSSNEMYVQPPSGLKSWTVRVRWPDGSIQRKTVQASDGNLVEIEEN